MLKLKLFLQRHYKKIVVPFICVLLSFSLVLVASAETYNYNLWQRYSQSLSNYLVFYEDNSFNVLSTRISNHNSNVPDAILAYNVPDISAENGLTSFYLRLNLGSSGPYLYQSSSLYLSGNLISNFNFVGSDGTPCTLRLSDVSMLFSGASIVSTSSGTNSPISGTNISTYSYFANFNSLEFSGRLTQVSFRFVLDKPAYQTEWASHELQYSCSLSSGVNLQVIYNKADAPIYTPPDQGTLDSALGVEGELIDEVGGDLDRLDGLLDSSNINDDTIYKPISAFTAIFQDLFERNNAVGSWLERLLNFSVAVGLSGFVLNIVVGIVSHFSAHSRDGSNNPKGGGS